MKKEQDSLPNFADLYMGKSAEYWRDVSKRAWERGDFKMRKGEVRMKSRKQLDFYDPIKPASQ
jgi:hypothetical protein